jgi:hypothetical protein
MHDCTDTDTRHVCEIRMSKAYPEGSGTYYVQLRVRQDMQVRIRIRMLHIQTRISKFGARIVQP